MFTFRIDSQPLGIDERRLPIDLLVLTPIPLEVEYLLYLAIQFTYCF